jgi:hypothetical protein
LKVIIKENAMPGTKSGGLKAAETNRKRYGKTFYVRIGALGGKKITCCCFSANPELSREAGRKGCQARK